MKIEKISDNQIKFLLTNEDLKERQIKLSELAQGSERAQTFFREIMTEAMVDCGFDASNTPLMIEAMPASTGSVIIIVSKVNEDAEADIAVSLTPKTKFKDDRKFKQSSLIEAKEVSQDKIQEEDEVFIYSFKTLNDVISLSTRICKIYTSNNVLYKYQDRYFLVMNKVAKFIDKIEPIIFEYAKKHTSTIISKYHLIEHAEIIIEQNAIQILSEI